MRSLILSVPREGCSIQLVLRSGCEIGQVILVLPDEVNLVQPSVQSLSDSDAEAIVSDNTSAIETPAGAQGCSISERSDYQQRLLVALYCHYNTSANVDEMFRSAVMAALYQKFVQITRSSLTRDDVHRKLRELELAGLLGNVSLCWKCNQLRCNVKAHLCPLCEDKNFGSRSSEFVPPPYRHSSVAGGGGGSQIRWHPHRENDASPWQEKAIRDLEDGDNS